MKILTIEQQQKAILLLVDFVNQYPSMEELVGTWSAAIDLLISVDEELRLEPPQHDPKVIYAEHKFKAR